MEDCIKGINELGILENKHRKEKKELQAQIQALKKVAKNDKTKKKELTAEIARLETDLDNRQRNEIDTTLRELSSKTQLEVTDDTDETKVKLSKAQKRRAKKEQQEKEREQEIKLQEEENLNGPRNLEIRQICNRLKQINLQLYHIPSDGDCLYNAISHQLLLKKKQSISVEDLRKYTSMYIREHKEDFMPFLSSTDDMLTESMFEEYCENIINSKVWGGQIEIRALSNYLKCPISIIQAKGAESIEQGEEFEGPSLVITFHSHMYFLGAHYNSTVAIEDENVEN